MRLSTNLLLAPAALALAACGDATSPRAATRVLTAVSADAGPLPATHYCDAPAANAEQYVAVGNGTLTVEPSGAFTLEIGRGHGTATYHLSSSGTKVYDSQSAVGGSTTLTGTVTAGANGARLLAFPSQADPDHLGTFGGRLEGDSAIVTDRVPCPYAVGADSVHTFTVVMR